MASPETIRVEGLRSLLRATDKAEKQTKKLVRDELRRAAEPVRDEARRLLAPVDSRSASRIGISVRKVGLVSVEQRLRRTTGKHPQFGSLQMRKAFVPALGSRSDVVVGRLEEALDRLADEWGTG